MCIVSAAVDQEGIVPGGYLDGCEYAKLVPPHAIDDASLKVFKVGVSKQEPKQNIKAKRRIIIHRRVSDNHVPKGEEGVFKVFSNSVEWLSKRKISNDDVIMADASLDTKQFIIDTSDEAESSLLEAGVDYDQPREHQ